MGIHLFITSRRERNLKSLSESFRPWDTNINPSTKPFKNLSLSIRQSIGDAFSFRGVLGAGRIGGGQ